MIELFRQKVEVEVLSRSGKCDVSMMICSEFIDVVLSRNELFVFAACGDETNGSSSISQTSLSLSLRLRRKCGDT